MPPTPGFFVRFKEPEAEQLRRFAAQLRTSVPGVIRALTVVKLEEATQAGRLVIHQEIQIGEPEE